MRLEMDTDLIIALVLIAFGVLFIFKPELVGIIIGLFLILMGVNSLTKRTPRGKPYGWRKKA